MWYYQQGFRSVFNISHLLEIKENTVDWAIMEETLQQLIQHHEGLRVRLVEEKGQLFSFIAPWESGEILEKVDLTSIPQTEQKQELENRIEKIQFDFRFTPDCSLYRFVHFSLGPEKGERLLFCVHHFILDGYGLGILLEDLVRVFRQRLAGEKRSVPPKFCSLPQWMEKLEDYLATEALLEVPYWSFLPWEKFRFPLEREHIFLPEWVQEKKEKADYKFFHSPVTEKSLKDPQVRKTLEDAWYYESYLTREQTRLFYAIQGENFDSVDVLILILLKTFQTWTERFALLLDMVESNRTPLFPGYDLSRIVGHIAEIAPIPIDIDESASVREQLQEIHQQRFSQPRKGIGSPGPEPEPHPVCG